MTSPQIERYVEALRRELRRHFIVDPPLLDEVREHLADAVERERREESALAEEQAIARFGSPELVAAALVADRTRIPHRRLLASACLTGIAIACLDARPAWDDAGITAGAMAVVAAMLGLAGPLRPWRWGLAVGLWIPAYALVHHPAPGTVAMLLVLVFPCAGACVGRVARGLLIRA